MWVTGVTRSDTPACYDVRPDRSLVKLNGTDKMGSSELSPLLRHWSLLTALASRQRGMTIREMADDSGVSTRTIRRDLISLQSLGFPLRETVSDHGRKHWRLGPGHSSPAMSFNWEEAAALYLGRHLLKPLAGTHLWSGAQSALRKIRATLGEPTLRYLEKMADAFHYTTIGHSDYARKSDVIDRLMIAIEDRRIAFITYQSLNATEPATRDVYPFGIVYHRGSLYLVALAVEHDEVRHYKVDRIEQVELDNLRFIRPDDFSIEQHLADSFGIYQGDGKPQQIRVRFSSEVARYVEESHWHESQQLTTDRDGSLIFSVTLNSTEEIGRWILSFGAKAEVLEPASLQRKIIVELRGSLRQYGSTSPHESRRTT